jgi:hypothetical protein
VDLSSSITKLATRADGESDTVCGTWKDTEAETAVPPTDDDADRTPAPAAVAEDGWTWTEATPLASVSAVPLEGTKETNPDPPLKFTTAPLTFPPDASVTTALSVVVAVNEIVEVDVPAPLPVRRFSVNLGAVVAEPAGTWKFAAAETAVPPTEEDAVTVPAPPADDTA